MTAYVTYANLHGNNTNILILQVIAIIIKSFLLYYTHNLEQLVNTIMNFTTKPSVRTVWTSYGSQKCYP